MTLKVRLLYLTGSFAFGQYVLGDASASTPLQVTQRMSLDPAQFERLNARLRMEADVSIALVAPFIEKPEDLQSQIGLMRDQFIQYFHDKNAAGIVNTPNGMLYLFPPCDFAHGLINPSLIAPIQAHDELKVYMVAVLVRKA